MSFICIPQKHDVFIDDFKVGSIVIELDEYIVFYSNGYTAYTEEHLQYIANKMKDIEKQSLGKYTV